jgi:triosephosphate isomerase
VRYGLAPLICIGETLAEWESGRARAVLETQIRRALFRLSDPQKTAPILFAYEPAWAIGVNGVPATSDYADARLSEIAAVAEDVLGRRVPCLYGGSVNANNCEELVACPHVDGLFIGRSAWQVEGYLDILARCSSKL